MKMIYRLPCIFGLCLLLPSSIAQQKLQGTGGLPALAAVAAGPLGFPLSLSAVPKAIICTKKLGTPACKPAVKCAPFFMERFFKPVWCETFLATWGTCCPEVDDQKKVSRFPEVSSSIAFPISLSPAELNGITQQGSRVLGDLAKMEAQGFFSLPPPPPGQFSAASGHAIHVKPSPESINLGYRAIRLAEATKMVAERLRLPPHLAGTATQQISLVNTPLAPFCDLAPTECPPSDFLYRSIDGSCNNPISPKWGKALTQLERILPPDYADGVWSPKQHPGLPSARKLSDAIFVDISLPDKMISLLTMHWGQFVSHDLSFVSSFRTQNYETIACCEHDGTHMPHEKKHPVCYPISIEHDDKFYSERGVECMSLTRSVVAPRDHCTLGYAEQLNQVSHYLDASHIYGSSIEESTILREFKGGRLKVTLIDGKEFLPVMKKDEGCLGVPEGGCFVSGDSRTNQNSGLAVLHNLFLRTHNRIARLLKTINHHWKDEKLYQETRKIVGAIMQHITYNEYLPTILGLPLVKDYGLVPKQEGYTHTYDKYVKTAITNEFATAAYRFGHSLISNKVELWLDDLHTVFGGVLPLEETFNNPEILLKPGTFDVLLRGMMIQPAETLDEKFASSVTNFLFKENGKDWGFDLASINVHRGRDHGLPGYNQYRAACGLKKAHDFIDLADTINPVNIVKLKELYNNVDDIDLYIGGLVEKPVKGGIIGPVFSCIIADQFARIKDGDRFYYELGGQPTSFKPKQLDAIRKASLASLICDNSDKIEFVTPFAFWKSSPINPWIPCGDLDHFSALAWKELPTDDGDNFFAQPEELRKLTNAAQTIVEKIEEAKETLGSAPKPPIDIEIKLLRTIQRKVVKKAIQAAAVVEKIKSEVSKENDDYDEPLPLPDLEYGEGQPMYKVHEHDFGYRPNYNEIPGQIQIGKFKGEALKGNILEGLASELAQKKQKLVAGLKNKLALPGKLLDLLKKEEKNDIEILYGQPIQFHPGMVEYHHGRYRRSNPTGINPKMGGYGEVYHFGEEEEEEQVEEEVPQVPSFSPAFGASLAGAAMAANIGTAAAMANVLGTAGLGLGLPFGRGNGGFGLGLPLQQQIQQQAVQNAIQQQQRQQIIQNIVRQQQQQQQQQIFQNRVRQQQQQQQQRQNLVQNLLQRQQQQQRQNLVQNMLQQQNPQQNVNNFIPQLLGRGLNNFIPQLFGQGVGQLGAPANLLLPLLGAGAAAGLPLLGAGAAAGLPLLGVGAAAGLPLLGLGLSLLKEKTEAELEFDEEIEVTNPYQPSINHYSGASRRYRRSAPSHDEVPLPKPNNRRRKRHYGYNGGSEMHYPPYYQSAFGNNYNAEEIHETKEKPEFPVISTILAALGGAKALGLGGAALGAGLGSAALGAGLGGAALGAGLGSAALGAGLGGAALGAGLGGVPLGAGLGGAALGAGLGSAAQAQIAKNAVQVLTNILISSQLHRLQQRVHQEANRAVVGLNVISNELQNANEMKNALGNNVVVQTLQGLNRAAVMAAPVAAAAAVPFAAGAFLPFAAGAGFPFATGAGFPFGSATEKEIEIEEEVEVLDQFGGQKPYPHPGNIPYLPLTPSPFSHYGISNYHPSPQRYRRSTPNPNYMPLSEMDRQKRGFGDYKFSNSYAKKAKSYKFQTAEGEIEIAHADGSPMHPDIAKQVLRDYKQGYGHETGKKYEPFLKEHKKFDLIDLTGFLSMKKLKGPLPDKFGFDGTEEVGPDIGLLGLIPGLGSELQALIPGLGGLGSGLSGRIPNVQIGSGGLGSVLNGLLTGIGSGSGLSGLIPGLGSGSGSGLQGLLSRLGSISGSGAPLESRLIEGILGGVDF